MIAKPTEHVRYVPVNGTAACYHCGQSYQVTPCSLKMAATILRQWQREHRRCKRDSRGDDLRKANEALFEALPVDKRDGIGRLSLRPDATLGEKIAHQVTMDEMAKLDLGDVSLQRETAGEGAT